MDGTYFYKQLMRFQTMKPKASAVKDKIVEEKSIFSDIEEYGASTRSSKPNVGISNKGVITFGKAMLQLAGLAKEDLCFIVIKYSKANNAILFNLSPILQGGNSFKMSINSQATISIAKFFKYYNIDLEKYCGSYTPELIGEDWVIFLDKD